VKCDANAAMQAKKCVPKSKSRSKIHKFWITCHMA